MQPGQQVLGSIPRFNPIHKILGVMLALPFILVSQGVPAAAGDLDPERVKQGKYVVNSAGCHDCHTPWIMKDDGPGPDMSRMLSGHPESLVMPPPPKVEAPWVWIGAGSNTAFAGPWGISFTKNLTPDPTGLGSWTEEDFINAIRLGKSKGNGRPIMPPMPWRVYRNLSDDDLKAVFAYLRSIPPIKNTPPSYQAPVAP